MNVTVISNNSTNLNCWNDSVNLKVRWWKAWKSIQENWLKLMMKEIEMSRERESQYNKFSQHVTICNKYK